MNYKILYLIFVLYSIFLYSCKEDITEEDKLMLVEMTKSEDIEVYEDGKDLIIEVYQSEVKNSEDRKLFYTAIAKVVVEMVNKKRDVLFMDGINVVNFIDSIGNVEKYEISNTELMVVNNISSSLHKLLQAIYDDDKEKIMMLIDNQILSSKQREELVSVLINGKLFKDDAIQPIFYGYERVSIDNETNNVLSFYVDFESPHEKRRVIFNYMEKSKKLIGVEEVR
ncbi:MAG: hypothetical protein ACJ04Q_06670 [Flavobacteriales bacterium]